MSATIGIIGEHKPGEGRMPLTPDQIKKLISDNPGLEIIVQPSEQRVFSPQEFEERGIRMASDLSEANFIMAVKEIDVKDIHSQKAYMFFSHTIKGQDYNMPMLQHVLDSGATLLDYELIKDDKGRRLVFFGRHAGLAGMVNTLWTYGRRLKLMGQANPFEQINQTMAYEDLDVLKKALGALIPELSSWMRDQPALVVGITGYGNVSKGAQEILDIFPHAQLSATELMTTDLESFKGQIVKVVFKEEDMFEPLEAEAGFELQDYFDHPEKYRSRFNPYLKRLNILVNCIYWDTPYPRLITLQEIKDHFAGKPTLSVVGDITCDIDGAIQFNTGSTLSPDPVYVYEVDSGARRMGIEGHGPVVMAVDNLPTELPREASEAFGDALLPFVPALAACDYTQDYSDLKLPAEVKRAVIAHKGSLTPKFQYLQKYLGR